VEECTAAIVTCYRKEKEDKKNNSKKYLKRGVLNKIIEETKKAFGLEENIKICEETIRSREKRGQTTVNGRGGLHSPLEEIEEVFVEFLVKMSAYNWPLSVNKGIDLVNSLIEGTKYEKAVRDFQERFCAGTMKEETVKGKVGQAYWNKFME